MIFLGLGAVEARPAVGQSSLASWPAEWQADGAFEATWVRADGPVAMRSTGRSWMWGPVPFAVANEEYAESSTGRRLVEYLDKGRMEVNDPSADRGLPWFVTSGLLVKEMVAGQVQTGNSRFEAVQPAGGAVAGDPGSPDAPSYSAFGQHITPVASAVGSRVSTRIGPDGVTSSFSGGGDARLLSVARFDEQSGHNVPAVFADWMNQSGPVVEAGRVVQGKLMDPLYVLGRPITEAYWTDVLVGGKPATVVVQLFERRALTYNPSNAPEWQVEMANVGRTYFEWRYGQTKIAPAVAAQAAADGVRVRGWNWPPGASVTVQADLAGGVTPLADALGVTSDSGGRFSTRLGYSAELKGALQSRANVRISARSGDMVAQLPFVAEPGVFEAAGLEGVLTHVERAGGLTNLVLARFDGTYRRLEMPASAQVLYSEGGVAPPRVLDAGMAVRIEGSSGTGTVAVSSLRIMSESRTGARVGYTWLGTSALTVSGTGWPQQKAVAFGFVQKGGAQSTQLGSLTADSRGNLVGRLAVPGGMGKPAGGWIQATSTDGGQVPAQVSLPVSEVPDAADGNPPKLFLLAGSGGQSGELGNYCSGGGCSGTRGFPLPAAVLSLSRGEGLRLRAQPGMDPTVAATPASFSVQLYKYPADAYGAETSIGSLARFEPSGQPMYSIAVQEGRPFSMSVPQSLASGAYVLVVSTAWPNASGRIATSSYAFGVRVP